MVDSERVERLTKQCIPEMTEYRRHIHADPELSGEEERTSVYVAGILRGMGLKVREGIGGYGVSAVIEGRAEGRCVALRADMDALSIREETGLSYASRNDGVMHACGHDCHTAMLLGAARVLTQMRDSFDGSVKLIFQPSEENSISSGAKAMIADGILMDPPVDAVFGQHVRPGCPVGSVLIKSGPCTAASDRFFITVEGKNAHGSAPDEGTDAIVAAAQAVTALQTVISRNVSPLSSSVLTIGKISGGERYNVIPEKVEMEGTCRNTDPAVRDRMPELMERAVRGAVESAGAGYRFRYIRGFSPTVNDAELTRMVLDMIPRSVPGVTAHPEDACRMTGEDFSFYSEHVPSVFYWLGCDGGNAGRSEIPLHSSCFSPSEDVLPVGCRMFTHCALEYLSAI